MEPEKDIFDQMRDERESQPWVVRQWNSLYYWWKFDGQYTFKNIRNGLSNLIYWFPVVWKDRHWDDYYIFEVMMHKLKAQSKYIGARDIHVNAKRDAEIMMTCVRLMQLIREEHYRMEYMDYEKNKHWFEPCEDKEGYSTWESKQLEENFDDYFAKYPLVYKRVLNGEGWLKIEDENDKHRIASNIAHINHDRARNLLFKIMEQEIETWWD